MTKTQERQFAWSIFWTCFVPPVFCLSAIVLGFRGFGVFVYLSVLFAIVSFSVISVFAIVAGHKAEQAKVPPPKPRPRRVDGAGSPGAVSLAVPEGLVGSVSATGRDWN